MKLSLYDKYRLWRITQNKTMIDKLKSRKLWATVIAGALATIGTNIGVSSDLINTLVQLVMVYVGSQAVVDAASAATKK